MQNNGWKLLFVGSLLFILSGALSLIYEIAWFRRLQLTLGVSAYAIGAVVVAFMLGLALGSKWAGRVGFIRRHPLYAYALMELLIGVHAALFPYLIQLTEQSYILLHPLVSDWGNGAVIALRFVLALAVLLPPTLLMGATLPTLSQALVRTNQDLASRTGLLYALNTFGAVVGTFVAGFYLLEHYGIKGTLNIAMLGNLLVAGIAALLAYWIGNTGDAACEGAEHTEETAATRQSPTATLDWQTSSPYVFIVIALIVSGLTSMAAQIVWTRALIFFIHNSTYAYSAVLAVYLLGLALGTSGSGWLIQRVKSAGVVFALLLTLGAFSLLGAIAIYRTVPDWIPSLWGTATTLIKTGTTEDPRMLVETWGGSLRLIFGVTIGVVFLPAVLQGALFPFALKLGNRGRSSVVETVGTLYFWNTLGSVVGTLLGTFALVPLLGTRGALLFPSAVLAILAALAWIRFVKKYLCWLMAPAVLLAWVMLMGVAAPKDFYKNLFAERYGPVTWFSEGMAETVAICTYPNGGSWIQFSDGRGASGTVSHKGGWLYAHLPLLLHPAPKTAAVICFGTGNTLGAASRHPLDKLVGIELANEVVKASPIFKTTNYDPANNPKVTIQIEDGRNFMLTTKDKYDVITEEPPLIHTAGVVNLYSSDFYQLCSTRLTDDGIMAVWLATWELEKPEVQMLVRSFLDAFPYAQVWDCQHFREWVLIGSKQPLKVDLDRLKDRLANPAYADDLKSLGITSPADFLALQLKDRSWMVDFAEAMPAVTDDRTVVDFVSPRRARANFGLGETTTGGLAAVAPEKGALSAELQLRGFDRIYMERKADYSLVTNYGAYAEDAFKKSVQDKQALRDNQWIRQCVQNSIAQAFQLLQAGRSEEALLVFEKAREIVPRGAHARLYAGTAIVYFKQGNEAKSKEAFGRAIMMDPSADLVRYAQQILTGKAKLPDSPPAKR
ncbi:MAG: fused MFS/spermidine synthase [Verrucomicrobiota bacterium]|nr:fused MFS/spermidine synthase [Verrucomicrobiota bacterium]